MKNPTATNHGSKRFAVARRGAALEGPPLGDAPRGGFP
jgi:hypothetical protein